MFPGLTDLHFIGCLIELIWTQKSKSNTSTRKTQLADILTKENFTRDEWNHMLCLFNISHFSPTVCSEAMAKKLQQDSGEERVTAKSRPMMTLIARVAFDFFFPRTELMKASKRHKCRRQKRSAKNDNEGSFARTC